MSGHRGSGRYARGHNALGHCGRCSKKMLLRHMVYDGQIPDLLVCKPCWDPKHPQEYLPDVFDPVTLYDPTGDTEKASNELVISLDQLTTGRQRSVGEESSIPVQAFPIGQNPTAEYERVVYNPLQVNLQVGISRFQLIPSQDPAQLPDSPDIPPPTGSVLAISGQTSATESPIMLWSKDDVNTWVEYNFDDVPGSATITNVYGLTWAGSRWVAVGGQAFLGAIWTCDDAVITAASRWTSRTPAVSDVTIYDVESANGVVIAVGQGKNGPARLVIQRSTDGGLTWEDKTTSNSIGNTLYCVRYRGSGEWWAMGGNGQLAKSFDNGVTWTGAGFSLPASGGNVYGMEFVDLTTAGDKGRLVAYVWTASANTGFWYTDNGASSWVNDSISLAGGSSGDVKVNPNTGTMIGVTQNGNVWRSTDKGANWTQIVSPNIPNSTDDHQRLIYQDNSRAPYGFIILSQTGAGGDGVIWSSQDDGLTWTKETGDFTNVSVWTAIASADEYKHDSAKNTGTV